MTPTDFIRDYARPKPGHVELFRNFLAIYQHYLDTPARIYWDPYRVRKELEKVGYRFGIAQDELVILNIDTPVRRYIQPLAL